MHGPDPGGIGVVFRFCKLSFLVPKWWLAGGWVRNLVHSGTVAAKLCVLATWMPPGGWVGRYLGGTSSSAQSGGAPCTKVRVKPATR